MAEKRSLMKIFSLILALSFFLFSFISTPKVAAYNYPEIRLGDSVKGKLGDAWDGKFYQFRIEEKKTVKIKYSSSQNSNFCLYDNRLKTIFTLTNLKYVDKPVLLEKGNYIIGIYNNGFENGNYNLSLSSKDDPVKPTENTVKSISFSSNSYYLDLGTSLRLPIIKIPKNIKSSNISWSSSNPKTVSVTKNGKVKARRMGKVVITAKIDDKIAVCNVYVNKKTINVLNKGKKALPKINGKRVKWVSKNKNVAKVVRNSVMGISQGSTVVTATVDSAVYYVNVYSTSPKRLVKAAKNKIKASLADNSSLIIFHRYKGYNSLGEASVVIDYAIKSKNKIRSRGYFVCSYNSNFVLNYYSSKTMPNLSKQKEF